VRTLELLLLKSHEQSECHSSVFDFEIYNWNKLKTAPRSEVRASIEDEL
jgi:hypothetical protein